MSKTYFYNGSIKDDVKVIITTTNKPIPLCCVIENLEIDFNGEDYTSKAELTDLYNKNIRYEDYISSIFKNNILHIHNPFSELNAVGNEIALCLLLKREILTIHTAACFIDGNLFLFCGKSNSGKTTAMETFVRDYPHVVKVCDDHLHLKFDSHNISFSTPIWDPLNTRQTLLKWQIANEVHIFDLNLERTFNKIFDLCRIAIGMSSHPEISFSIINKLELINGIFDNKIFIYRGEYQNYSSIKKYLEKIVEGQM